MNDMNDLRLCLQPGAGMVARFEGVVLLVPAFSSDQQDLLAAMIAAAREASGAEEPGRALPRRLAGLLIGPDGERMPGFCAVGALSEGAGMMVYGDTEVEVSGGAGNVRISGKEAATWVDRIFSGAFHTVSMRGGGQAGPPETTLFELVEGIVPAAAVRLEVAGAPATPAQPPVQASSPADQTSVPASPPPSPVPEEAPVAASAPAGEPAATADEDASLVVLDLSAPIETEKREPLPLTSSGETIDPSLPPAAHVSVKGIRCKHGHFNHPHALYCAYDGSAMVDVTRLEVEGPRPSLGVLIFDDGSTYGLEMNYVLGRAPHRHEAVVSHHALPLPLEDQQERMSRAHLLVQLEGWDVHVQDLGSRNGTFIQPSGATTLEQLPPNVSRVIQSGTRVQIGDQGFIYRSHHST